MRFGWLTLLLGLGLVACSSANNAAPAPSAQPTAAQTALAAAASPTPAQIVTPASSPATAASTPARTAIVTPASTAVPAAPAAAAAVVLTQPPGDPQGWHFAPAATTVRVGVTLNWTNPSGNEIHTVTADDGKTFDSGVLSGGDSFSFTFLTAGAFPYHCTLHGWMKGVVTVVP